MYLIVEEGALDGEGASMEGFAHRLGIGARHLTRLNTANFATGPLSR